MTVIRIPVDYLTLQAALNAASDGDTIRFLLGASPYAAENAQPPTNLSLIIEGESSSVLPEVVIDGGTVKSFFRSAAQGDHPSLIFRKLHVKNCYTSGGNDGGAIYAKIRDSFSAASCIFEHCYSDNTGGALSIGFGSANANPALTLFDTEFLYNLAKLSGGAVYCNHAGSLGASNVHFYTNEALGNNGGGAICIENPVADTFHALFEYVTFRHNIADFKGGAVSMIGLTALKTYVEDFINSILWGNVAGVGGSEDFYANLKTTLQYWNMVYLTGRTLPAIPDWNPNPLHADPLFAAIAGHSFLSQIDSGEAVQSLAVNWGNEAAIGSYIQGKTTRTNGVWDDAASDCGFHYLNGHAPIQHACIDHECVMEHIGPGPNMAYPEFEGQLSGTVQGNDTKRAQRAARRGLS